MKSAGFSRDPAVVSLVCIGVSLAFVCTFAFVGVTTRVSIVSLAIQGARSSASSYCRGSRWALRQTHRTELQSEGELDEGIAFST